eukprot:624131-Pyramimonas_sp.AAC.1
MAIPLTAIGRRQDELDRRRPHDQALDQQGGVQDMEDAALLDSAEDPRAAMASAMGETSRGRWQFVGSSFWHVEA